MQKLWAQNKPPSMLNDALADVSAGPAAVHALVAAWCGVGVRPGAWLWGPHGPLSGGGRECRLSAPGEGRAAAGVGCRGGALQT